MDLSEREQLIFDALRKDEISTEDIARMLRREGLAVAPKRATHTISVLMKYLTAKACQEGWIISMVEGGRGAGNIAVYSMEKRF
jgi:hypothetical protein